MNEPLFVQYIHPWNELMSLKMLFQLDTKAIYILS